VRRGGYKTEDSDKAILKAKKMFFRLKPTERIEQAMKAASGVIDQQERRKNREKHDHASTVQVAAHRFIMGTGFSLFLEHIKTMTESEQNKINKARTEHERIGAEMLTIEKVKSQFENGKTALVIKDDGKYLVKIGDAIQLYDDNTLPNDMRGKLGMLKLVEAEAFVSNTGCRINDEVFVLVVEET
jgi:dihydroxyacetone kinase DhaKLM complex PTS-EIIA-like component DhaM